MKKKRITAKQLKVYVATLKSVADQDVYKLPTLKPVLKRQTPRKRKA